MNYTISLFLRKNADDVRCTRTMYVYIINVHTTMKTKLIFF